MEKSAFVDNCLECFPIGFDLIYIHFFCSHGPILKQQQNRKYKKFDNIGTALAVARLAMSFWQSSKKVF